MRSDNGSELRFLPHGVIVGLLLLTIQGCSTALPPPGPIDDESSALGVTLHMRTGLMKATYMSPDVILFARLEDGESVADVLNKDQLIPSSFADGEQAYLLNVSAGTYVAVAALYAVKMAPTAAPVPSQNIGSNVKVGVTIDMFGGKDTYRNYLSQELIEQTKTTIGSGEIVFMGRFLTDQSLKFGDGDPAQMHFLKVLEGKDEAAGFVKDMFSSDHARRLSSHYVVRDEMAERKFFKNAKKHLKDTAWVTYIDG